MHSAIPLPLGFLFTLVVTAAASAQPHPHQDVHDSLDATDDHPRCGTMEWVAVHQGGRPNSKLPNILAVACEGRPEKQATRLTENGHFRVHYDLTGRDAVPSLDANSDGMPDFMDSVDYYLEAAWDLEINQYGFDPPPPDNRGPGPEIDVFLCDLTRTYYGLAVPEDNNPTGPNTVSGYLILDNDFAGYPSEGIAGLRVTAAHEFHHIIQFSRYRYDFSQAALYEATSVWLERQFAPDVPDYIQYVEKFLTAPQNYGLSTHKVREDETGYAHVLFMDYLEKKVGVEVVRRIWERFRDVPTMLEALDLGLRDFGLNLADSYCEFAEWCYYTGVRAVDGKYFDEARLYPTMRAATVRKFEGDDMLLQADLYPLSFGLYKVAVMGQPKNDTIDFLITNARTDFGRGGPGIDKDMFTLDLTRNDRGGFKPIVFSNDTIFFKLDAPSPQFCVNPIIGGQTITFPATLISPQPFVNDGASRMIFGVTLAKEQVQHVRLWIYSATLTRVAEVEQNELLALNSQLGVLWNGRDYQGHLAPSGIYIYELSINGGAPLVGKFAVVRK